MQIHTHIRTCRHTHQTEETVVHSSRERGVQNTHTHAHTHRHRHRRRGTHTHTHKHIHTHTHMHLLTSTYIHIHTRLKTLKCILSAREVCHKSQRERHTHTLTRKHSHTQTHVYTYTHQIKETFVHSCRERGVMNTQRHTHTHSHAYARTIVCTRTYVHTHVRMYIYPPNWGDSCALQPGEMWALSTYVHKHTKLRRLLCTPAGRDVSTFCRSSAVTHTNADDPSSKPCVYIHTHKFKYVCILKYLYVCTPIYQRRYANFLPVIRINTYNRWWSLRQALCIYIYT